jgi:hypothetical protein
MPMPWNDHETVNEEAKYRINANKTVGIMLVEDG